MRLIKAIAMSPYLNLITGVILFASGLLESLQDYQDLEEFHFGIHHGITLFSLVQILKTIPEFFESFKYISHAEE